MQEGALRIIYFLILHTMYILGYTCQGAATRGAQSTLTNDPKQRPMVSIVSGILTLLAVIGVWQKDRPEVLQHHSKIRKSAQNAPAGLLGCAQRQLGAASVDPGDLYGQAGQCGGE